MACNPGKSSMPRAVMRLFRLLTTRKRSPSTVPRAELIRIGLWLGLIALAVILLEGSPKGALAQSTEGTEFIFAFESDDEGWITGFADLPANFDQELYELKSGFRPLPEGLEGNGMYLQGHNRSDDIFMFLKKQVVGLKADTTTPQRYLSIWQPMCPPA